MLGGAGVFLAIELLFFAANLTKFLHGAWFPLLVGVLVFTVLITWQRGRVLITARRQQEEGELRTFVDQLHDRHPPLERAPGTAVFLNRGKTTTPLAMRANVVHNRVLHEHALVLAIETLPVPVVPVPDRVVVDDLGYRDDGITHITAHFGYMETPNVPGVLAQVPQAELEAPLEFDEISDFLSRIEDPDG